MPTGSYAGWSAQSGKLVSSNMDVQVNVLTAGNIIQSVQTTILKGYTDQIVEWKLSTTNVIPKNGYINA